MVFEQGMKYLLSNVLGCFVLDEKLKLLNSTHFTKPEEFLKREKLENELKSKNKDLVPLPIEKYPAVLDQFKDKKHYPLFFETNLYLTKQAIKNAIGDDALIMQAIANINELDKACNLLVKRLREWYSLYFPELSTKFSAHEKYVELVVEKERSEMLKEMKLAAPGTMGADLAEVHLKEIKLLANDVQNLYKLRKQHELYLQKVMKEYCPNLLELAGVTIGAKLIELGKGLKNIALLPASTIQLLGAEKALFRHIKTGSKSPKYGVIINHPIIQNAAREQKGKASRMLADKLSLCARLDYFKGEFKAPQYRKELEEKLGESLHQ